MSPTDRLDRRCWLDWWANSVTSGESGWKARGQLANPEDREAFDFFCDLDPVFSLRFDDESTITADVHPIDDNNQFVLTEYTGPTQRTVEKMFKMPPPS